MGCYLTREFSVETKSGKPVTAEVEVTFYREHHYGADADGNRGREITYLEDIGFTVEESHPSWKLDDNEESLSEEETKDAQALLLAKAEKYDWSDELEWYAPDPDRDRD